MEYTIPHPDEDGACSRCGCPWQEPDSEEPHVCPPGFWTEQERETAGLKVKNARNQQTVTELTEVAHRLDEEVLAIKAQLEGMREQYELVKGFWLEQKLEIERLRTENRLLRSDNLGDDINQGLARENKMLCDKIVELKKDKERLNLRVDELRQRLAECFKR